ncbi:hypothetical protein BMS3Bbin07_00776 [bacterium BMS3Bbin07]|nr:hypothetical protein BMS3Bbin07_00776 [bacterium BMS3Bbin07]
MTGKTELSLLPLPEGFNSKPSMTKVACLTVLFTYRRMHILLLKFIQLFLVTIQAGFWFKPLPSCCIFRNACIDEAQDKKQKENF